MKLFKSRLFRLIVTIVSILMVVSLSRSIMSLWGKYDIVKDRERELVREQEKNTRLKAEFEQVQSPEFIEREAREKLGMVKEGEAVVLMPQHQSSVISHQSSEERKEDMPSWKKWWRLFF